MGAGAAGTAMTLARATTPTSASPTSTSSLLPRALPSSLLLALLLALLLSYLASRRVRGKASLPSSAASSSSLSSSLSSRVTTRASSPASPPATPPATLLHVAALRDAALRAVSTILARAAGLAVHVTAVLLALLLTPVLTSVRRRPWHARASAAGAAAFFADLMVPASPCLTDNRHLKPTAAQPHVASGLTSAAGSVGHVAPHDRIATRSSTTGSSGPVTSTLSSTGNMETALSGTRPRDGSASSSRDTTGSSASSPGFERLGFKVPLIRRGRATGSAQGGPAEGNREHRPPSDAEPLHKPHTHVTVSLPMSGTGHGHATRRKKTLVLDLDQTLVHAEFKETRRWDMRLETLDRRPAVFYVSKRPYLDVFLRTAAMWYNLVIYTASLQTYADPVISTVDPEGLVEQRLFRPSCVKQAGTFVKDLSLIEPDLRDVIIVDDTPAAYSMHDANAVPIEPWYDDEKDEELLNLLPLLHAVAFLQDVRSLLGLRLSNGVLAARRPTSRASRARSGSNMGVSQHGHQR